MSGAEREGAGEGCAWPFGLPGAAMSTSKQGGNDTQGAQWTERRARLGSARRGGVLRRSHARLRPSTCLCHAREPGPDARKRHTHGAHQSRVRTRRPAERPPSCGFTSGIFLLRADRMPLEGIPKETQRGSCAHPGQKSRTVRARRDSPPVDATSSRRDVQSTQRHGPCLARATMSRAAGTPGIRQPPADSPRHPTIDIPIHRDLALRIGIRGARDGGARVRTRGAADLKDPARYASQENHRKGKDEEVVIDIVV